MLSHTVGLEHDEMFQKYRSYTQLSPSHTVGSELLGIFSIKACRKQVTIPHSGLGTAQHYNKAFNSLDVSSSHTVGLEPMIHAIQRIYYEESPSHAVGLEQLNLSVFPHIYTYQSPSHTVGLEPQITTLTKIRHINNFVKRAPPFE